MEDNFRVRVDKIFGSLTGGNDVPSAAAPNPSMWCLTDEEIERRQWNRHVEDDEDGDGIEAAPSDLLDPLESDLQQLSDYDDEEDAEEEIVGEKSKQQRKEEVDWDVESNIGRDPTLDFEEEEDKYDKVAVGTEQSGDRLYMKDIKHADYGIDELNTYGELPTSLREVSRDPRANHTAAKIRLKEDAEASGNFDTSPPLCDNVATNMETEDVKRGELNIDIPKSILKKRENLAESKSQKRVRFMCDSKSNVLPSGHSSHDSAVEHVSDPSKYSSGIPDYIRNPSKYTCYTFDDSFDNVDDQSNKNAYLDFFESLRKRNADDSSSAYDTCIDITKPVVFTRKTKPEDASIAKRTESGHNKGGDDVKNKDWSISVTAEDVEESELSAMEEDLVPLPVDTNVKSQKPGRKYRARITEIDD